MTRSGMPQRLTIVVVMVIGLATAICVTAPQSASAAPAAPTAPQPSAAAKVSGLLGTDQALAKATLTGKAVTVSGATTDSATVTARPDGTLALSESAVPVRKFVNGRWLSLDPTVRRNADGSITPAVTTSPVVLSGGGSGPLATLGVRGRSLALSVPMTLPTPTLSGATATYSNVLPGVDVQATVDEQGTFSEVVVVHSAAAAANPILAKFVLATKADGIALAADPAGNITGVNAAGQVVVMAAAPMTWDSASPAVPPTTIRDPSTGRPLDKATNNAVHSSAAGPGESAHTGRLGVSVTRSAITLTPDPSVLSGPGVDYPVYIDPTFVQPVTNPGKTGYASIASGFPTTNRWNGTADPDSSQLQVGFQGSWAARSLVNFPIYNSTLAGASIMSATFKITEDYSWQCSTSGKGVSVYAPATTLTSANATWDSWSGVSLGSAVDTDTRAVGHDSGCPSAGIPFVVTDQVASDVAAKKTTQTFALKAASETDVTFWKKFDKNTATLEIDYDHTPATPTSPSTSPATTCGANNTVGNGDVTLKANITDVDGGVLGVAYTVTNTAHGNVVASTNPNANTVTVTRPSPTTTASFIVHGSTLAGDAHATPTEYTWQVNATDYHATSSTITCHFTFDPTIPGTPTVTPPGSFTYGQPALFAITAPLDVPSIPASYLVQLNSGAPQSVTADANGNATATVTPNRVTSNQVTITSVSAGHNIGQTYSDTFDATAPTNTQADADLTRDGRADFIAVGGRTTLPAGVWLDPNTTSGLGPTPIDIGTSGVELDSNPADFNGYQVITGAFSNLGTQDVIAYNPGTGPTDPSRGAEDMYALFDDGTALPGPESVITAGNLTDVDGSVPSKSRTRATRPVRAPGCHPTCSRSVEIILPTSQTMARSTATTIRTSSRTRQPQRHATTRSRPAPAAATGAPGRWRAHRPLPALTSSSGTGSPAGSSYGPT